VKLKVFVPEGMIAEPFVRGISTTVPKGLIMSTKDEDMTIGWVKGGGRASEEEQDGDGRFHRDHPLDALFLAVIR
jgi:hypothetical protein